MYLRDSAAGDRFYWDPFLFSLSFRRLGVCGIACFVRCQVDDSTTRARSAKTLTIGLQSDTCIKVFLCSCLECIGDEENSGGFSPRP